MRETISRRATLKVLVTAPVLGAVLSACGKKDEPDSCNDVSALSEGDKTARNALQYVDSSPYPDKRCSGCTLFKPSTDPAACSACQVVKGPIHPDGYCSSWAKKA